MDKQTYNYLKSVHRCVQCGARDAYTLNGRTYCAECVEKRNAYYRKRREDPEYAKKWYDRAAESKNRLQEAGLCPNCGKKATPPYIYCEACRKRHRASNRERKRAKREAKSYEV